jgi:hypothetical protein
MRIGAVVALLMSCSPLEGAPGHGASGCPTTAPNGFGVLREGDTSPQGNHGNDARTLATSLAAGGTVTFKPGGPGCVEPDGTLGMKFPWWRGVRGDLVIQGRRLDGDAPPLRASIPRGYGPTGFQSTGLLFPTAGCWEVTGRVADERLTFVVFAEKIGAGPAAACRKLGIYERPAVALAPK